MRDMMIGVNLAKNVFQVHGALRAGEIKFRNKLTRKLFPAFMARQEPCLVIFEACGSAHYWARDMEALGHEVKLIAPQYARPLVRQAPDAAHEAMRALVRTQTRAGDHSQRAADMPGSTCGRRHLPVIG